MSSHLIFLNFSVLSGTQVIEKNSSSQIQSSLAGLRSYRFLNTITKTRYGLHARHARKFLFRCIKAINMT
ncbi:MAG: hypothetical protein ACPGXX_08560, partial [Planctomycetaceae bacterium]